MHSSLVGESTDHWRSVHLTIGSNGCALRCARPRDGQTRLRRSTALVGHVEPVIRSRPQLTWDQRPTSVCSDNRTLRS